MTPSEALAQQFHEAYERLAPSFGYETRAASAKPWADVPEHNRRLMVAVCGDVLLPALHNARAEGLMEAAQELENCILVAGASGGHSIDVPELIRWCRAKAARTRGETTL